MIRSLLHKSRTQFASKKQLVDFPEFIEQSVLPSAPSSIGQATIRNTKEREQYSKCFNRTGKCQGCEKNKSWTKDKDRLTVAEAIREAQRCLKCTDAPCQKGCSTSIDIKSFIYNIEKKNWYGAAKIILTDNPLGLSCGQLCPISELCARNCNVSETEHGAIKINRLQEFAVSMFKDMGVKQVLNSSIIKNDHPVFSVPIALIGAGAASLSCATFLGRLGYKNVTIFEKNNFAGGLIVNEIPMNRSPLEDINWEIEQVKQLGVKFIYGKELGKDFTLESLKKDGYQCVFVGCGLNESKKGLGNIYDQKNIFSSKTFLPQVNDAVKIQENINNTPQLNGHVIVLGIGDTALDCARSAYRCGAERVSVIFRRGWQDIRANDEILIPAKNEGINFIPYEQPIKLNQINGQYSEILLESNLPINNNPYQLKYKTTGDQITIKFDYLITAFGSEIQNKELDQYINKKKGFIEINEQHQVKGYDWLYAGGDAVGIANLVDAVNDGKTSSWHIHKYLQQQFSISQPYPNNLPSYTTEIDKIDLSINILGVKFPNPFGLASAPPTTSYPMIKRAFQEGWGFAVIKTFVLDKDAITNVSPRIYKSTTDPLRQDPGFANIELISEKSAKYWLEGSKQIKKEFPNHVLIGSIMCQHNENDWKEITKKCKNEGQFDMLELNLSCPHGMTELGMGRACGENPDVVREICQWVTSEIDIPVIVKITPNYPDSAVIAQAAKEGGAKAVTMTNTFPTLMDPDPLGTPWPAVGSENNVTYGGGCGSMLRPIALRKTSEVAKAVPDLVIFGSGGIIQGDHALSFLRYGASALQVCSAVQDQDSATVFYDLKTSLQAHIYAANNLKQKGFKGQFQANQKVTFAFSSKNKINDLIGSSLNHIKDIAEMKREDFLIPKINEDSCLKCGRCYLTCLDSGYQAIKFDNFKTFPSIIEDLCTGCALCHAVCPVEGSITMEIRATDIVVNRGLPLEKEPEGLINKIPSKKK